MFKKKSLPIAEAIAGADEPAAAAAAVGEAVVLTGKLSSMSITTLESTSGCCQGAGFSFFTSFSSSSSSSSD